MPKASSPLKHPRHMTTEEAVTHLFHPKVIASIRRKIGARPSVPVLGRLLK